MRFEKGQSFIELLIAMGVFTLIISAVVFLVLDSYVSHRAGREKTLATFLAEEGLEATRSIRNNDWDDLKEGKHGIIITKNGWAFSGTGNNLSSRLNQGHRVITVEDIDPDRKKIISSIEWKLTENRPQEVVLTTYLTNWQKGLSFSVFLDSATYSILENEKMLFVNVNLSATSDEIVTIDCETGDGTAVSPDDYLFASTTLVFNPDTVSEVFEVKIVDDSDEEGNETFNIVLSNPRNVELGNPSEAIVTIWDDDTPPHGCWGVEESCDSSCQYSDYGGLTAYYVDPGCVEKCSKAGSFYISYAGVCSDDGIGLCYKMEYSSTQYLSCSQGDSCAGECAGECTECKWLKEEECEQQEGCNLMETPWGLRCVGRCVYCENFGDEGGCSGQLGCEWKSGKWYWVLDNSSLGYSKFTKCEWYE